MENKFLYRNYNTGSDVFFQAGGYLQVKRIGYMVLR